MLRRRFVRILFLLLALILLATITWPGPPPLPRGPIEARLFAAPVALDERHPERRRVGGLVFLRGWELSSDALEFGAVSAMQVEGGRVVAISDAGTVFEFELPRRAGALPLRIVPLPGAAADKSARDTEALVLHGGRAWAAYEGRNVIVRYRRDGWAAESAARPAAMREWRSNSGPEAMVRLPGGRFLVFAEGARSGDTLSPVLLFDGDPATPGTRALALRYRRPEGFRVTDAALLPDGRLLILSRRVGWTGSVRAKLEVADPRALAPGGIIEGREVAELASPLTVDNMEALSVAREGGRTIVRIASDDNFMAIQRTLLLEFAFDEAPSAPDAR